MKYLLELTDHDLLTVFIKVYDEIKAYTNHSKYDTYNYGTYTRRYKINKDDTRNIDLRQVCDAIEQFTEQFYDNLTKQVNSDVETINEALQELEDAKNAE